MTVKQLNKIIIPDNFRRGGRSQKQLSTIEDSGLELLELMQERLGLTDYSQSSILDVGCGTRLPTAILNKNIPVKKYTGMDVHKELIQFLQDQIVDDRFEFHHLDLHNEKYNSTGQTLTLEHMLPIQDTYNVVCLFSVFTHLNPQDADCMLYMLSRYINENGKLIFTCFLDATVSGFDDRDPKQPLLLATYTESFMRHLIGRNGWNVEALYPPIKSEKNYQLMQYCFVCTPNNIDEGEYAESETD